MTRGSPSAGVAKFRLRNPVTTGPLRELAAKVGGLGVVAAIVNVPLETAARWNNHELVPDPPTRLLFALLAAQHEVAAPFPELFDDAVEALRTAYLRELHKACDGNQNAMANASGKSPRWIVKGLNGVGLRGAPEREYWVNLLATCHGNVSEMARESGRSRPFVRKRLSQFGLVEGEKREAPRTARAYWGDLLKACGGNVKSMAKQSGQSVSVIRRALERHGLRWGVPPERPTVTRAPPAQGAGTKKAPRLGRSHAHEITDPEALLRAGGAAEQPGTRQRNPTPRPVSDSAPSLPAPPARVAMKPGETVVRSSRGGVVVRRHKGGSSGRS